MSVKRLEVVIAGLRAEIASLANMARRDIKAKKKVLTLRQHIKGLTKLKKLYAAKRG
jgi:hypothetical protein